MKTPNKENVDTMLSKIKGYVDSALALKENISNKVTSISLLSTDDEYPSAKCVYDIVGDIETLLGGI